MGRGEYDRRSQRVGLADVQAGYGGVFSFHGAHDGGAGAALQRFRYLKVLHKKGE